MEEEGRNMSRLETHTQPKLKKAPIIVGILALLFIATSITFWLIYPKPSDERVSYFEHEQPLIYQERVYYNTITKFDGQWYLALSFLKEHIDQHITFDEASSSVIVTNSTEVFQMPTERLNYYLNEQDYSLSFPAVKKENDNIYVAAEWLETVYPIKISHDKNETTFIYQNGDTLNKGVVTLRDEEDVLRLRTEPSLMSPYVKQLTFHDEVVVEADTGEWYLIRTKDGVSGYLKKTAITLNEIETVNTKIKKDKQRYFDTNMEWPIHLTWDAIYSPNATPNVVPELEGVQVLSPTWFHLNNGDGDVRNYGSISYVKDAHNKGYHVWGLFSNDFEIERTNKALSTYETRQKIIRQLLHYASIYQLDGINLDFENVYEEDGNRLTQFVRELTPLAHEAGLVISIDITFISNSPTWSKFYEREELAEIVDYMMVMAYDEHWGTSPVAGSVASLPWVEHHLQKLLEVVPSEKLLLGIPFYTRLWKEEMLEDGTVDVSSKALSMSQAESWINSFNLEPIEDPKTKQMYVEYSVPDEPITYKMWLEDKHSLIQRAELVHKYRLAGVASWSSYFASKETWSTLYNELNYKKVVKKAE